MMGEEGSFETSSRDFTSQKTAVFKQYTTSSLVAVRDGSLIAIQMHFTPTDRPPSQSQLL